MKNINNEIYTYLNVWNFEEIFYNFICENNFNDKKIVKFSLLSFINFAINNNNDLNNLYTKNPKYIFETFRKLFFDFLMIFRFKINKNKIRNFIFNSIVIFTMLEIDLNIVLNSASIPHP